MRIHNDHLRLVLWGNGPSAECSSGGNEGTQNSSGSSDNSASNSGSSGGVGDTGSYVDTFLSNYGNSDGGIGPR